MLIAWQLVLLFHEIYCGCSFVGLTAFSKASDFIVRVKSLFVLRFTVQIKFNYSNTKHNNLSRSATVSTFALNIGQTEIG